MNKADELKIPTKYPTKSHRRHYEKKAKREECFIIRFLRQLQEWQKDRQKDFIREMNMDEIRLRGKEKG